MSEDPIPVYAIRVLSFARAEIDFAHARITQFAGERTADEWQADLEEAISYLATNPIRPLIAEQNLFQIEVRQLLYRSGRHSFVYRVLFTIQDNSPDGPQVIVLRLRHASTEPIKPYEARQIESDLSP